VQNIEPSPHRPGTAYVAIYRYLLGDFAPYIYRTDDYGKSWTRLTDGTNGIAADEPTRVVREDPSRAGLLYAGTEFGLYVSFNNGKNWQSFQQNLPVTPVTDIKVAYKDLVVSTQGRSFWILDDLTPLHQINDQNASANAILYQPREAIRTPARGFFEGLGGGGAGLQYPRAGAMIDYYLASAPEGEITMEILDAGGKVVRKFSSAAQAAGAAEAGGGGGDDEEGGGFRGRGAPVRLDKKAGMHRFTWDLHYPGAWMSRNNPEGPNGPTVVPGNYSVQLSSGTWKYTASFTVIEDPRITQSGVTMADLREQFEHNMKVRDLVSEVNKAVARVRTAERDGASGDKLAKVKEIGSHLITPPIRYSTPELQTHIAYLYSMTTGTDQKIGRDAIARYAVLRKELDGYVAELNQVLGVQ
jgi:hypothetical protein